MQKNKKRIEARQQSLRVACALTVSAVMGCDTQPSPSSSAAAPGAAGDSAAAYAELSKVIEQCEESYESCLDSAADETAAQACETQAESCREQKARPAEQNAKKKLDHEAHWCHKICNDEDAGPGGSDDADAGSGDLGDCIVKKAPKLPRCTRGLVECLAEVGGGGGEATGREIGACVSDAHACVRERVVDALRERWERRHGEETGAGGSGGAAAGGSGGSGGAAVGGAGGSGGAAADDDEDSNEGNGRGRGRGHRHRHFWFPFWLR
jgi:hypothetical protein